MRRAALLALIAASAFAGPAHALEPGPQIAVWDTLSPPGVTPVSCSGVLTLQPAGGFDGGAFLRTEAAWSSHSPVRRPSSRFSYVLLRRRRS